MPVPLSGQVDCTFPSRRSTPIERLLSEMLIITCLLIFKVASTASNGAFIGVHLGSEEVPQSLPEKRTGQ